jgi:hypothetical protein
MPPGYADYDTVVEQDKLLKYSDGATFKVSETTEKVARRNAASRVYSHRCRDVHHRQTTRHDRDTSRADSAEPLHANLQGEVLGGKLRHGRGVHTCANGDYYGISSPPFQRVLFACDRSHPSGCGTVPQGCYAKP